MICDTVDDLLLGLFKLEDCRISLFELSTKSFCYFKSDYVNKIINNARLSLDKFMISEEKYSKLFIECSSLFDILVKIDFYLQLHFKFDNYLATVNSNHIEFKTFLIKTKHNLMEYLECAFELLIFLDLPHDKSKPFDIINLFEQSVKYEKVILINWIIYDVDNQIFISKVNPIFSNKFKPIFYIRQERIDKNLNFRSILNFDVLSIMLEYVYH